MIIKKKYTSITKNQPETVESVKEETVLEAESVLESKPDENKQENVEVTEEVKETLNEEKKAIEPKKKKKSDLDISFDDIKFEQREERREGSRRRGYRRTQDRNIVSRAQKDALSIKEVAKTEGYKEGISLAQKDIENLKSEFSKFYNYKDEVFNKVSECIMEISIEIAKKILNKEIETNPEYIISSIKAVVSELNKTEDKITLKVMPKDVEIVKDKLPEIFSGSGFEAKLSVIPDNNIKDGGVVVETSNGIVDASIETQLEIIEQALKEQPIIQQEKES